MIVFRPNFLPTKQDNFRLAITEMIVIKYANHDEGVKRFLRFHIFVFPAGYFEKKYCGRKNTGVGQWANFWSSSSHLNPYIPRSASSV